MRGLRIIVATPDAERLRGALALAAAHAAMGGGATIFLQLDAVALLRRPVQGPCDEAHRAAGLPSLAMLIDEALELGVEMVACQSGLALSGMGEADLPAGAHAGGPMSFLQATQDEARLLFI